MKFESNTSTWALVKGGRVMGSIVAIYKRCTAGLAVQVTVSLWDKNFSETVVNKGYGYDMVAAGVEEIMKANPAVFGITEDDADILNKANAILERSGYTRCGV